MRTRNGTRNLRFAIVRTARSYRTNAWTRIQDMNTGRWYNGTVALPNCKVFTMLGETGSAYPELWTEGQGWSLMTGATAMAR